MSDLVKRLRDEHLPLSRGEVADEVEELEAKLAKVVEERDEALNQLDSARHSINVLEQRVAELKGDT